MQRLHKTVFLESDFVSLYSAHICYKHTYVYLLVDEFEPHIDDVRIVSGVMIVYEKKNLIAKHKVICFSENHLGSERRIERITLLLQDVLCDFPYLHIICTWREAMVWQHATEFKAVVSVAMNTSNLYDVKLERAWKRPPVRLHCSSCVTDAVTASLFLLSTIGTLLLFEFRALPQTFHSGLPVLITEQPSIYRERNAFRAPSSKD